jgi:hypothetical protein
MNDRIWRELVARAALAGLSLLLLACSAGLFYVGYLNYRSGPSANAAPGTETAWRLFTIAAALALGGAALLKQSLLPARVEFD